MAFFNQKKKLWKQGQTTLSYVTPQSSFSQSKRFKHFSIYWPDKSQANIIIKKQRSEAEQIALKISKQIDEQQKNQMRMGKGKTSFRRNASKSQTHNKQDVGSFRETKTTKLSKQNEQIINRLTQNSFFKQSLLRDRHGNRTNLLQNQEDDELTKLRENKRFRSTDKGFYTSRRVKLQLPHNYYPGPGSYEIRRYLEQEGPKSHRPKSKQSKQL